MKPNVVLKRQMLVDYIVRHNLSFSQFADLCELSRSNLHHLLNGKHNPTPNMRGRIIRGTAKLGTPLTFDELFYIEGK